MKRIWQHPEAEKGKTGKNYWRSLGELSNTPDFRDWLEREFPQGAAEWSTDDGLSRRNFLRLMGASMALAGLGLSACRRPEAHLVPFTKTPEWLIPGKYLHYSTAMPRRNGAMPLQVKSYNGRPIKIEGNPLHPYSMGKSDAFAQATILELYDPERSRSFLKDGKPIDRKTFDEALEQLKQSWSGGADRKLAFLVDETCCPTRERFRSELFPDSIWCVYEPLLTGNSSEAASLAFGGGVKVLPHYDKADLIFSVDCDFLECHDGNLKSIRDFMNGRRVRKPGDKMNRLYAVESHYTITGATADHRLRLPASHTGAFVLALAKELVRSGVESGLAELVSAIDNNPETVLGVDKNWIREAARDLIEHRRRCLVVIGDRQPTSVHILGLAINEALGNLDNTLSVIEKKQEPGWNITELADAIGNGSVETLVIVGGNPVYNSPVDIDWKKLLKKVPTVIRLGMHEDETSALSHWHVPQAHYLESWSDAWAEDGSYLSLQPMILPLHGGLSDLELMASLAGVSFNDSLELVQETFRGVVKKRWDAFKFEEQWNRFLHDGFLEDSAAKVKKISFDVINRCVDFLKRNPLRAEPLAEDRLELVFVADRRVDDGRFVNNAWMQEFPDPITKMTWENAALMSPTTAKKLGIVNETVKGIMMVDKVKISWAGRSIEAPVLITPGSCDFSLALPVGYGREITGKIGEGSGFNAYALRVSDAAYFAVGASIKKVDGKYDLALTQEHNVMEGRALVREAPLEYFNQDPNFTDKMGIDAHAPSGPSFYHVPPMNAPHQWGMSIDLTTCTGCNACVVACQSENNIPVVGKDQVQRGREMHWIRIDRYFSGEDEEDPQMMMQPIACMQCENAPCETVCPVNATVHNDEGLNVMAYNRCIGTRYCANNCPYKVRRFNFFDFNQRPIDELYKGPLAPKGTPELLKMSKNPNVTVRMRGVMEKCTFCVQRLEMAKIDWRAKQGASPDVTIPANSVQTACQQACPADAIVFGNLKDEDSEIAKVKTLKHDYALLEYLNIKPRVSYLGRIRNPNPKMPGADKIGMTTINEMHHHGHEENDGKEH
ncbi:MAG: TAT-variant-translocated molybdopterin oxidoreductase [Verrucomicrobiia bacterium]